jgi:hypothetical protein
VKKRRTTKKRNVVKARAELEVVGRRGAVEGGASRRQEQMQKRVTLYLIDLQRGGVAQTLVDN